MRLSPCHALATADLEGCVVKRGLSLLCLHSNTGAVLSSERLQPSSEAGKIVTEKFTVQQAKENYCRKLLPGCLCILVALWLSKAYFLGFGGGIFIKLKPGECFYAVFVLYIQF